MPFDKPEFSNFGNPQNTPRLKDLEKLCLQMQKTCGHLKTSEGSAFTGYQPSQILASCQSIQKIIESEGSTPLLTKKLEHLRFPYPPNTQDFHNELQPEDQDELQALLRICLESGEELKKHLSNWLYSKLGEDNRNPQWVKEDAIRTTETHTVNLLIYGSVLYHQIGKLKCNNKKSLDQSRIENQEKILEKINAWEKDYFTRHGSQDYDLDDPLSQDVLREKVAPEIRRLAKRLQQLIALRPENSKKSLKIPFLEEEDAKLLDPGLDPKIRQICQEEAEKAYRGHNIKFKFVPLEQKEYFLWLASKKLNHNSKNLYNFMDQKVVNQCQPRSETKKLTPITTKFALNKETDFPR